MELQTRIPTGPNTRKLGPATVKLSESLIRTPSESCCPGQLREKAAAVLGNSLASELQPFFSFPERHQLGVRLGPCCFDSCFFGALTCREQGFQPRFEGLGAATYVMQGPLSSV